MTGLAHLFEHLMYGGSASIPDYDLPIQLAGGETNAFTNNDITNFYLTLPPENIETGFWLESDRMLGPEFSRRKLDIQKNVVMEEFRQRYLNQPYGDVMHKIRQLAYKIHPYRWPAIGMDILHVANIRLKDVKDFFYSHYAPNNAILTITGNIDTERAHGLASKWFGTIPERTVKARSLPREPVQTEKRILAVEKDVPSNALYKVWHSSARKEKDFYTMDLLTDILAGGESGRLHTRLVRKQNLFSEINAYITSDIDPGLVVVHGRLMNGIGIKHAELAVDNVINELKTTPVSDIEMEKVKNKFESSNVISNTNILNKAVKLAFHELLGDASEVNRESEYFRNVDKMMVRDAANKYFSRSNSSTLFYLSTRNK